MAEIQTVVVRYRVATIRPEDEGCWTLRTAVFVTEREAEAFGRAVMHGGSSNAIILREVAGQVWAPGWLCYREAGEEEEAKEEDHCV